MLVHHCPNCGSDDLIKTATSRKQRQGVVWVTLTYRCQACATTCLLTYDLKEASADD